MRWIKGKWSAWRLRARGQYRKSLITILLLASLPGIVIGFIIFWFVKDQMEQELRGIHQTRLMRAAETIDDHFNNAELLLAHWVFDPKFNQDLTNLDFRYNYKEIHDIYRTLLVMEGSNPLFERVELFINEPRPVVFTKDVYRFLDTPESLDRYHALLEQESALYWHSGDRSISLVHKIPVAAFGKMVPYGAVVIHLNEEKVLNLVEMLTPYNEGTTFLFEEDGRVLLNNQSNRQVGPLGEAIYEQALAHEEDTFLFYWDNETYAVTSGQFNRLGATWRYVSAAPLTSITSPLIFLSKLIIGMNLFILLLAGLLSWLASRKLYSPIARLMSRMGDARAQGRRMELPHEAPSSNEFELIEWQWNHLSRESQILQTHLDKRLPHLREGFLMQLMQGYMHPFSEKEQDRMENYGWTTQDRRYAIVLVQLLGFARLEGRFSEGDEGLVTFAAANIVEELVGSSPVQADVINFHDLSLGLLVSVDDRMQRGDLDEVLYRLAGEMIACFEDVLKMQATLVIGRMTDSVRRVPVVYEEAKLALRFRDLQGSSQVLDLEKLDEGEPRAEMEYPFELEKEITYALRLGDEERSLRLIRQFIRRLTADSATEAVMKQAVLQLLGSILHVVMQSGVSTQRLYEGSDLYARISQIHDPEEIGLWFERRVVHPFMNEWMKKKDKHMRRLVENSIIILNREYMTDISLEYCADQIKISPYVLSKAFKKITGMNFIDYLTRLRLEQAKRMLRDTEWKISDIAEKVGYQNSYFNRLFKKYEDMTPGQYREQGQDGEQGQDREQGQDHGQGQDHRQGQDHEQGQDRRQGQDHVQSHDRKQGQADKGEKPS